MIESSVSNTYANSDCSIWFQLGKIEVNSVNNSFNYAVMNAFCVVFGTYSTANFTFCDIYNNSSPGQGIFWGGPFEMKFCQYVQNYQCADIDALLTRGTGKVESSIFLSNICYKLFQNSNIKAYNCFMKNNTEISKSPGSILSTVNLIPFRFDKFIENCSYLNNPSCIFLNHLSLNDLFKMFHLYS